MGNGSLTMTKFTWPSYIYKIYNETSQVRKEIFERKELPLLDALDIQIIGHILT